MRVSDEAALAVDRVSHGYGATPVLRECSFAVPAGAVVGLLGRNGAGKTTLIRAVVGLLRPYRGTIRVFGQPVLSRIGYVSQRASLYPMLTVAQTLRLGARLNPGWDMAYAQRLVHAGGLRGAAKVGTLAAGQRTRLAIAMALGKRPDLLVLDEPLAHLDPVARVELIGAMMAMVAERGMTVLMSSHAVADLQDICDHVVVLGGGRARLAGAIEPALREHRLAVGALDDLAALDDHTVIDLHRDDREFTALVKLGHPARDDHRWDRPTLDELLLGYLRADAAQSIREMTVA